MKTAVILHLCILISFVFVVKCEDDDEGEFGDDAVLSNMKCLGKDGMILLTRIHLYRLYLQCAKQPFLK